MLNKIKSFLVNLNGMLRHAFLVFAGIVFWIFIVFIAVISIPAYIYRWLIVKIVAPFYGPHIGKIVSVFGQLQATEFTKLRKGSDIPSRLPIVVNLVIEGDFPLEKAVQLIESRWIRASFENGKLKYPEFQQYIDRWMGLMFFKQMNNFRLEDHIFLHKLNENGSDEESEIFIRNLTEELVNKPFPPKKSPWEVHLVQNYRNSEYDCESGKLSTVFMLRIHHGMADGFAVMHIIIEALMGHSIEKIGVATPNPPTATLTKINFVQKIWTIIGFPIKFLSESGFSIMTFFRRKTSWHIPDRKKTWKQIYGRSRLIPIEKLKIIKERLGVTLTSVLVACTTGASAEMMSRSMTRPPSKMVYCYPVALARKRRNLRNQTVGVVLDIPCNPSMDIVSRLKECELGVQIAKKSVMTTMGIIVLPLFSSQLAVATRYLLRNRYICSAMSNFPGPGIQIHFEGMKVLAVDAVAGGLDGQAGVTFMILSYKDNIRICALGENAILTRSEMDELIENVCHLIDKLYLITNNETENVKINIETV